MNDVRGAVGFRLDGIDYITYIHVDAYPNALGKRIVADWNAIHKNDKAWAMKLDEHRTIDHPSLVDTIKHLIRKVRVVTDENVPDERARAALEPYMNLSVSAQKDTDWFCLTYDLQDKPFDALMTGYWYDHREFIKDSLFCEWAYVFNLDDNLLEVYEGFQKKPHDRGRYAHNPDPDNDFQPVALVRTFPLEAIPEDWVQQVDPLKKPAK